MDPTATTKITKQTSLRILKSGCSPVDIIKGLIHETPESTTFKCHIHQLDSLIQEDTLDTSLKIKSLRFRQLSHPPPSLFTNIGSPTLSSPSLSLIQLYEFVWKVELSCPLDIRWVYHVLLPALPKLSFLRFGAGCFEDFYYDYNNGEVNQYYIQLLALNYTSSAKNPVFPEVRELHVSIDEKRLSDFNYAFQALTTSINLILDFSIKYLKNSLAKTNLILPSNCAIDSFLQAFPKIRSKGEKIENYEKNITKFVTASDSSSARSPSLSRTSSVEQDRPSEIYCSSSDVKSGCSSSSSLKRGLDFMIAKSKQREHLEPPPTPFYTDREISKKKVTSNTSRSPAYAQPIIDVLSDSDSDMEDPRKPKLRIVEKSRLLAADDDDDDQICTSTTPLGMDPPPRPAPMERNWVTDIITSIANEDDDSDSSDSDSDEVDDPRRGKDSGTSRFYDYSSNPNSTQHTANDKATGSGRKSPSLLANVPSKRHNKFDELYTRRRASDN